MAYKSKISWTDSTWNPVTGCTPVSEACQNCYAAAYAKREIGDWRLGSCRKFSDIKYHPKRLDAPLHWIKPLRIFVCSMSDLFHEKVQYHWQSEIFDIMATAPWHTFFVLTKRPERMREFINSTLQDRTFHPKEIPFKNIYLGITAETQARADERIPILMNTPAAHRFVSVEPCLTDIDLTHWVFPRNEIIKKFMNGPAAMNFEQADSVTLPALNMVIVGGETGPGARPCQPDWVRGIKDQCAAAEIPFHFKGWGRLRPSGQEKGKLDGLEYRELVGL